MTTTRHTVAAAAIFLTGIGCAGGPDPEVKPESAQHEIIGGFRAVGKSFNAVGTVGMKNSSGDYDYFCSATLIAPKLVLTAKHCAMVLDGPFKGMKLVNLAPVFFAVGPDAAEPIKVVEAIAADLSPIDTGGSLSLGSDVALYHLAEAITDVTPLPLAEAALTTADIGKRFVGVGFGARDVLQDEFGVGPLQRRAGYMTIRALTGKPAQTIWPTFDDLVEELKFTMGDLVYEFLSELREIYDAEFLENYEVWAGLASASVGAGATADAQSCHGDSGGPLVGVGANPGIYGVVSGGYFSRQLTCDHGTFYATLGPKVREMITRGKAYTDPCAAISPEGTCTGTVATRCSDKFEGDRRLLRVDCADLGMVCRPDEDGVAACFDEGEPAERPTQSPPFPPPSIEDVRTQVRSLATRALTPARR